MMMIKLSGQSHCYFSTDPTGSLGQAIQESLQHNNHKMPLSIKMSYYTWVQFVNEITYRHKGLCPGCLNGTTRLQYLLIPISYDPEVTYSQYIVVGAEGENMEVTTA